jgi:hypothetical protein
MESASLRFTTLTLDSGFESLVREGRDRDRIQARRNMRLFTDHLITTPSEKHHPQD